MATRERLPQFVEPMLAKPGAAFNSDDYLFEIKWDGTRAMAYVEQNQYRLMNRRRVDITHRYPELAFLAQLPPGLLLDGEIVVLRAGKPAFPSLQSREQARSPFKIQTLAKSTPATYVVFDLLYESFQSRLGQPLECRRARLQKIVEQCGEALLVLSEGLIGQGIAYYEQVCRLNLEGVMAKRLRSRYLPGKRTEAWIKIKRRHSVMCAIIGFVPSGEKDFRSLILAAQEQGRLRCVGKVGTGFSDLLRQRLNELLRARPRPRPAVPCRLRGKWVEPGLCCKVSYLERTPGGEFRAPVFEELIVSVV